MPILRFFFLGFLALAAAIVILAGPQGRVKQRPPLEIFPDMDRQLKFKSQAPTPFFADGRADRPPVPGTIPIESREEEGYVGTGKMKDRWGDGIPVEVTPALLERGRERYAINCAVCHGATGAGDGITAQYGLNGIANLHEERFRVMADGQIFNTITHGKGLMGAYPHITVDDRWAVIAYVRALQLARTATVADLPSDLQERLK